MIGEKITGSAETSSKYFQFHSVLKPGNEGLREAERPKPSPKANRKLKALKRLTSIRSSKPYANSCTSPLTLSTT